MKQYLVKAKCHLLAYIFIWAFMYIVFLPCLGLTLAYYDDLVELDRCLLSPSLDVFCALK